MLKTRKKSLKLRYGLIAFLTLGWLIAAPAAHAQQIDLSIDRGAVGEQGVQDYDFSWVYWFETRGQRYLHASLKDRPLPWDTPASRRYRGEAVEALVPMLDDADDRVRAAAVLALGRIGHKPVIDRVLGSVVDGRAGLLLDESQDVRLSAWAALGLLDTPRARLALAMEPMPTATEHDRAAQAMAIGLLAKPTKAHAEWLAARLADGSESFEVKRWCVWSLERTQLSGEAELNRGFVYDAVLRELPSAFLISEVLLSPSYARANGGTDWLIDVLRYHPEMRRWPGYVALSAMPAAGEFGSTPSRIAMESRVAAALTIAELDRPEDREDRADLLEHLRRRMVAGNSDQAMDFHRGFETLAYVMHCDVEDEQLDLLYDQMRGITVLAPDDPALEEKRDELAEGEVLDERARRVIQSENEVRCYAALSAGLLIRRATEGTALHEARPIEHDRAIEIERLKRRFGVRLMRAVAEQRLPMSYRAACALALGLTGDPRYRAELAAELSKLRSGDEAVLGYGLLALSMLGEQRVVDPARRYVTRPGALSGMDDRLGRHAALRAVGLMDWQLGERAGQALSGAWGRDPWVSLHVAEATAWLGRYDAVPAMLGAATSESANWRRAAAMSLGVVFDRSFPSRLAGLAESMNPVLSLRPMDEPAEASSVADQDGVIEIDDEDEAGPDPAVGWPMGRLYALGDPYLFEVLRAYEPVREEDEEQEGEEEPEQDEAATGTGDSD